MIGATTLISGSLGKTMKAFRDGVDIAGENESFQVLQKILIKNFKTAEIFHILLGKTEILM